MQVYKIACVVVMFGLSLFLTIGGYILHRDRQWRRTWEKQGKPEVKGIKELRAMGKLSDYVEPPQILDHMLTHDPLDRVPVYLKVEGARISGIRGYIAGVKIAAWFARIIRRIKR